jgi:hypothetical protein
LGYGTPFEIVRATVVALLGFCAIAVTLQGADFIQPVIGWPRRIAFGLAGVLLLLPVPLWVDGLGVAILVGAWLPGFLSVRHPLGLAKK